MRPFPSWAQAGRSAAFFLLLVSGCRAHGTFLCETSEQCRGQGPGTCEPTGFCSFPDSVCPSGRRYDESAGAGYTSTCVEDPIDAAIDAPIDAAFAISSCPPGFNISIASTSATSRYRLLTNQQPYWTHEAACNAGLPGATHLVIPETVQEIIELSQYIDPIGNTGAFFFVGAVQNPNAGLVSDGWIRIDGVPLDPALWRADQPDDENDVETDHAQQLAYFDKAPSVRRMSDVGGVIANGAVCECDGKAIAPLARMYIDTDPNNPN